MTNGLNKPKGHLVMPISPNSMFVATRDLNTMHELDAECQRADLRMSERLNDIVARQSHRFVWGNGDMQTRFVEKRLGQKQRSRPFE
jgi:hypothetical protein